MPSLSLDVGDAAELAELLSFLSEWVAHDLRLEASLADHVGHPAYGKQHLRDDLERFIFLLGGSDGEHLSAAPTSQRADGPAVVTSRR